MKFHIVGGYVRDRLLGRPAGDRDWVVIGATDKEMVQKGFQSVGQSFPVYLHPVSKEEYALARVERKISPGHGGFAFNTADVTLEEDLQRRDLTINALVLDESRNLIDPFGGYRDLQLRLLRHVSPAFREDPLRVLRVARFAAQLGHMGFRIAGQTLDLMKQITASGELHMLPAERILQETRKALNGATPSIYFTVLREVGALRILFPEVDALFGIPQNKVYHPEVDTGIHVMMVIDQAARLCMPEIVRFACLCHDLGKATTPAEKLPSHVMHEKKGVPLVNQLCQRLKVKKDYRRLALLVCEYHLHAHKLFELKATTIVKLLDALDAWRRPQTVHHYIQACEADSRGRSGFENISYPQKNLLLEIMDAITHTQLTIDNLPAEKIQQSLHMQRCKIVEKVSERIKNSATTVS